MWILTSTDNISYLYEISGSKHPQPMNQTIAEKVSPIRPGALHPGKFLGGTKHPDLKNCKKHVLGH